MESIFNSETPSFVPETDILGTGQIDKNNFGLGGVSSSTSDYPGRDFFHVIDLEESQPSFILNPPVPPYRLPPEFLYLEFVPQG